MIEALPYATISEMANAIKNRRISSTELVRSYLKRIDSIDGVLNSFRTICEEKALAEAAKCDEEAAKGSFRGPFHGIPYALKDLFDKRGVVTTAGSRVYENFIPDDDAAAVKKLDNAGAVFLGKLNMNEFAFGITGNNPHYGDTLNPCDHRRLTGGSSSGSAAAVKAGLAPFALGTDTGGSIRIPSALCGICGLKPTYGAIDAKGVVPLAWSLDHVGPMARSVEDLFPVFDILAGKNAEKRPIDSEFTMKNKVIAVLTKRFLDRAHEDVENAVWKAASRFSELGAKIIELTIPDTDEADMAAYAVLFSEAAASIEMHLKNNWEIISRDVLNNVNVGMTIPAFRYVHAQRIRRKFIRAMKGVFDKADFLIAPATPVSAPLRDQETIEISKTDITDVRSALTRFTRLFNFSGNPVLTFPVENDQNGLPLSIQLVGRHFHEAPLMASGVMYQKHYPLD